MRIEKEDEGKRDGKGKRKKWKTMRRKSTA